jgi:phosphatidate cytidylyltransferase
VSSQLSNLTVRILSAAVLLIGGLAALTLNLHSRWLLMTAVLSLGAWELSRLVGRKLISPIAAWLPAYAVLALCLARFPGFTAPVLWNWSVAVVSLSALTAVAFTRLQITVVAPWIGLNAFVIAYLGLWGGKLFDLTMPVTGFAGIAPFVFTLACIAAADSGAYFAGRAFGKHKLAPELSSGKTREGAVGGLVAGLLVAGVLSVFNLSGGLTLPSALLLGAVLALASVAGDLFISAFKRWALAKDTSHLIPGHGGVMDRFDALIFAAPFAWIGFRLLGGGSV